MSFEKFLELLQCLLTMIDVPEDASLLDIKKSQLVIRAMDVIKNLIYVASESGKCNYYTLDMMEVAYHIFPKLVLNRSDFAGIPGDYHNNSAKRRRLANALHPGC